MPRAKKLVALAIALGNSLQDTSETGRVNNNLMSTSNINVSGIIDNPCEPDFEEPCDMTSEIIILEELLPQEIDLPVIVAETLEEVDIPINMNSPSYCRPSKNSRNDDDSDEDLNYSPVQSESVSNELSVSNRQQLVLVNEGSDHNNNEEDNNNQNKCSSKRLRRPDTWKRNVKKKKVNSGLAYLTEGNKQRLAKHMKPPCTERCRLQCGTKFNELEREDIFQKFWALADNNLQRQFVISNIEKLRVKYRRVVTEGSSRSENLSYFFRLNGVKIKVCKQFFMNTLDIGDKFIRTSWKKSDGSGLIETDQRGNRSKRESISPVIKDKIVEHINSFQRIESHYLRAQTSREFIDGSLCLSQMYRYYKEEQEKAGLPIAKKCTYEKNFNTNFNISFFQPKKDQCPICESYKNSNESERADLDENYKKHINNKNRCREEKARDVLESKENTSLVVKSKIVFGLFRENRKKNDKSIWQSDTKAVEFCRLTLPYNISVVPKDNRKQE